MSDYWNSHILTWEIIHWCFWIASDGHFSITQHNRHHYSSLLFFSPCFVYVLTWCLTEAVCYFSRASIRGSWPCFTALFHLALPALPPIPLHPDQLIDTCTAWHWEPAYSLIHEMQPSLKSLSAINTHTNTQTHTRVYTDTWAEEKQQKNTQRGKKESVVEPAEQKQEPHHSSSSLLDSALTHAELRAELRRHLAHSSDDDKSHGDTDRQGEEEREKHREVQRGI